MNDIGNILMKFGNDFWLILFWEYISLKLFAVHLKYSIVVLCFYIQYKLKLVLHILHIWGGGGAANSQAAFTWCYTFIVCWVAD
jgi:hypothetical protein